MCIYLDVKAFTRIYKYNIKKSCKPYQTRSNCIIEYILDTYYCPFMLLKIESWTALEI